MNSSLNNHNSVTSWVGRFAPTPSGLLHLGSLVAALGSYLIAKKQHGQWLLRIEDLDPPREVAGAAESILFTLESFGFEWDGQVLYQSQRKVAYQEAFEYLLARELVYPCSCSRKLVQQRNAGIYDGFCRTKSITSGDCAWRAKFSSDYVEFNDHILTRCVLDSPADTQDFVIKRRDGLFAYQLAVVVDDIYQQINHVVRGADILDSTPRQNFLYTCLKQTPPEYFHLPLMLDEKGEKLSKSRLSSRLDITQKNRYLMQALVHLGQPVDEAMLIATPEEILHSALIHWDISSVPRHAKKVLIG